MTDRDRLIELFEAVEKDPAITCPHYKTDKTCDTCKYTINNFMCNHTERTVDYLLANGVIVPPCKIGDTVYMPWVWNGTKGIAFFEVTRIIIDGLHAYIETDFHTDDEDYYNAYGCGRFAFDDFGKTVFLTKEEAEQALKERGWK